MLKKKYDSYAPLRGKKIAFSPLLKQEQRLNELMNRTGVWNKGHHMRKALDRYLDETEKNL